MELIRTKFRDGEGKELEVEEGETTPATLVLGTGGRSRVTLDLADAKALHGLVGRFLEKHAEG